MKIFRSVVIICLLCFNLFAEGEKTKNDRLKVLILGGTTFLGPHLTYKLLKHGHKVTHFNIGNGFSFPEVELLQGDRYSNMRALEGRKWDAVIDTSGYLPRVVEASSKILTRATKHYTFISTISVYADLNQLHINENASLATLDDNTDEEISGKNYGSFKVGCEKIIKAYFSDNSLIIRPGLIVGPYDPSDRFTYWVRRITEGGKVLLPNTPKQPMQFIDVRDLAKWIVKMIEEQAIGTYNATGPKEELSLEKFVAECSRPAKNKVEFVWVDEQFLLNHHIDSWSQLPLWLPRTGHMLGVFSIDSQKAQEEGLSYRPISETIFDTLKWDDDRADRKLKVGLGCEEEENLLNQFTKDLVKLER